METDTSTSDTPWSSEENVLWVGLASGSAAVAINLDAAGLPAPPVNSSIKRYRNFTSMVWNDFEELFTMRNSKKVRYGARCLHCSHEYSGKSSSSIGHLRWHILACWKRKENDRMAQNVLKFNPDGSIHHWEYSDAIARTELCRLIARKVHL